MVFRRLSLTTASSSMHTTAFHLRRFSLTTASSSMQRTLTPAAINCFIKERWNMDGPHPVIDELSDRHIKVTRLPHPEAIRPGGYVCGPWLFALADVGLWYACFAVADRIEPMALTTEMSIRFLRPAIVPLQDGPGGRSTVPSAPVHCRVDIISAGSRSVVGTATMWTDSPEKPVSVAQGTYKMPG
jgi:acyl-coenzyme A thioesterase PaaI-like protein